MTGTDDIVPPGEIEAESFALIEGEVPRPRPFEGAEWLVARRLIHASGDLALMELIEFHPLAVKSGIEALGRGSRVVTDTEMVKAGISAANMELLGCTISCHIRDPEVKERARAGGLTRAAAAVEYTAPFLDGAVYAVGNAPTALLRLLALVERGVCLPALILGMPVGFVNAAESKELLRLQERVPFITIRGRKGGSPLAATAVNQLALLALDRNGAG